MAGRSVLANIADGLWAACRALKPQSASGVSPSHFSSTQLHLIHTVQQAESRMVLQGQTLHMLWPWQGSWGMQQHRTVFGAPQPQKNLQIHTHDKYRVTTHQPKYKWMIGRFLMDRNGAVWHKQANQGKRSKKSSNTLSRMARWKSLHPTLAAKFRKLQGVPQMLKYWQAPDPRSVPGFEGPTSYKAPPRRADRPDKRPTVGDPALRPH